MTEEPGTEITLTLSAATADLLSALIDPAYGVRDLKGVVETLVSHARDGIMRPGSWEREWVGSVFGYEWTERLERDPDMPHHDRRRRRP